MKQFFALLILIAFCALTVIGQDHADPQWVWAESAGGTSNDSSRSIAVDHAGNSYITGFFYGTAYFGGTELTSAGDGDVFTAKMDAEGNFLWAIRAGGTNNDYSKGIAVDDEGNIYIGGYFTGTAHFGSFQLTADPGENGNNGFVAKLDAGGGFLWAVKAGGNLEVQCNNLALDAEGNAYITGFFRGTAIFGSLQAVSAGSIDIFTAKLDTEGNFLWLRSAGGMDHDLSLDIAVDNAGNSYIAGFFAANAFFGSTELVSAGDYDLFIAMMDAEGNFLWAERAGGSLQDRAYDIALDNAGNLYITGYFTGTAYFGSTELVSAGAIDAFTAKMDTEGNFLWAKRAGGTGNDYGYGIASDASGSSYITGCFLGEADFGDILLESMGNNDIYTAKMDTEGNFLWAKRAGGTGDDYGYGIAVGNTDNIYVTGFFQDTAYFGDKQMISAGGTDVFTAWMACTDLAVISIKSSGAGGIWVWEYSGGSYDEKGSKWTKIGSQLNAEKIVAGDITGDGNSEIIAYFPSDGLYYYSFGNMTWQNIVPAGNTVDDFAVADTGYGEYKEIVASFSDTLAVYRDSSWVTIMLGGAERIEALNLDRDINGNDELAVSSSAYGGFYIYDFDTDSYSVICSESPSQIIAGDADGDGYPEMGAVFEGFGTYLIRYMPDKPERKGAGKYEPFDLLRDIGENSKWVSKRKDGKGLQFARLTWGTPDAGHFISMGDIAEGPGLELFMVYGGRTYYYCSDTSVWATFLYAGLKRIIAGMFTADIKDCFIVCDGSTGDIWFRNADTEGWELLVPGFDTDAMGVLR